jgi:hypothetical protein
MFVMSCVAGLASSLRVSVHILIHDQSKLT